MKKAILYLLWGVMGILICIMPYNLAAQDSTAIDYEKIAAIVVLDSFIVTADRRGFEVEDFIRYVLDDESFYKAFKNLRKTNYTADNEITFYRPNGKQKARYHSKTKQTYSQACRTMKIVEEQTEGKFYKKGGQYRYYTAELYDRVFFTHGKVCESPTLTTPKNNSGRTQKNIAQLKQLVFHPGHRINVPLIGRRTAIFEPHMIPKYEYAIISGELNGIDCYIFAIDVKPEVEHYSPQKTIIKHMETYFDKENFQVMGRNYHLVYEGLAFSFDVWMDIKLTLNGDKYLPAEVSYNGKWSVPFYKREKARFKARFSY